MFYGGVVLLLLGTLRCVSEPPFVAPDALSGNCKMTAAHRENMSRLLITGGTRGAIKRRVFMNGRPSCTYIIYEMLLLDSYTTRTTTTRGCTFFSDSNLTTTLPAYVCCILCHVPYIHFPTAAQRASFHHNNGSHNVCKPGKILFSHARLRPRRRLRRRS